MRMNFKVFVMKKGINYRILAEKMGLHHRTIISFSSGAMDFSWKNTFKLLEVLEVGPNFTWKDIKNLLENQNIDKKEIVKKTREIKNNMKEEV